MNKSEFSEAKPRNEMFSRTRKHEIRFAYEVFVDTNMKYFVCDEIFRGLRPAFYI